jgi:hypothetical protein
MLEIGDVGVVSTSVLVILSISVRGISFSVSPSLIFLDGKLNLDIGTFSRDGITHKESDKS